MVGYKQNFQIPLSNEIVNEINIEPKPYILKANELVHDCMP